jgi:hypothetical protein
LQKVNFVLSQKSNRSVRAVATDAILPLSRAAFSKVNYQRLFSNGLLAASSNFLSLSLQ